MDSQALVIKLPSDLSREVRQFLDHTGAYDDLSELITVALGNQLSLEADETQLSPNPNQDDLAELLAVPMAPSSLDLPFPRTAAADPLFVLTNRLFPIKVACRVAANMANGAVVSLPSFQRRAAEVARSLGRQLREEDLAVGRKGFDRRWIGLPVSDDHEPALRRFISSFTLEADSSGLAHGPMAQFGLAILAGDKSHELQLTKAGWELAVAANPILDEEGDGALSQVERDLFVAAICGQPSDRQDILEFIEVTRAEEGQQSDVDGALHAAHSGWSAARVTSHRAALIGRLRDLGLASVSGRGPTAKIALDGSVARLFGGDRK